MTDPEPDPGTETPVDGADDELASDRLATHLDEDHDDVEDSLGLEALGDLRRRRRRNRLRTVHWIDALYRVYLTAIVGFWVVVAAASWLPNEPLDDAGVAELAQVGPAWLGAAVAVAVGIALRSGARGGPLTLEAPTVVHELGAPIDRRAVLRTPALKQLRFALFVAVVVGGAAGILLAPRVEVHAAGLAVAGAAAGALGIALAYGAALLAAGRRLRSPVATAMAAAIVAWSLADVALTTTTSPLTLLGSLALWPVEAAPAGLVALPLAVAAVAVGLSWLDGISIEAARRRAGLVSQLRFAVTLQDVRTVVLLRRQLAQERPRPRPWLRLRRGGALPAVWQRDLHGLLRFPAVRVVRLVLLGAVAGLCLGGVWHGVAFLVVPAGLALYLAAYEAVEPVAQEVDHPTRWDALPGPPGLIVLHHLVVALIVVLAVCGVAAAAALVLVPSSVVGQLSVVLVVPVAIAATVAAAVSTALGAADVTALTALGGEVLGAVLVARTALPPLLVIAAVAPVLAAGSDPSAVASSAVGDAVGWSIIASFLGLVWLRVRTPATT